MKSNGLPYKIVCGEVKKVINLQRKMDYVPRHSKLPLSIERGMNMIYLLHVINPKTNEAKKIGYLKKIVSYAWHYKDPGLATYTHDYNGALLLWHVSQNDRNAKCIGAFEGLGDLDFCFLRWGPKGKSNMLYLFYKKQKVWFVREYTIVKQVGNELY